MKTGLLIRNIAAGGCATETYTGILSLGWVTSYLVLIQFHFHKAVS
jgi:hypothetical protein